MKINNLHILSIETTRSYPATHDLRITSEYPVETAENTEQNKKPLQKEGETAEEILNSIEKINIQLESTNRSIRFNVDESTKDIVVKIVNKDSGELIKQIPPQEALRLKERLQDMLGLIIEEMA
jgi:flagellar protein FlaG